MTRFAVLMMLVGAVVAHAEDAKAKAAREELERQLTQMVGKPPTKVRIDYLSIDDPNYTLEEASFELDGKTLTAPSLRELQGEGDHRVWEGDVMPGKHTVKARLVFANRTSIVVSDEGGYKWKVGGDVGFEIQSGIEVRVQVVPTRDGAQQDIAKRFRLALPAQPVMLAKLDDGKMPDAMLRPVIVDAGQPVVAAAPVVVADAGVKLVAIATVEPVEQPSGEPMQPRATPRETTGVGPGVVQDAGEAPEAPEVLVAAVTPAIVDAGSSAIVPAPIPLPEEEGLPWWVFALVGVAALGVLFAILSRRAGRSPRIDE